MSVILCECGGNISAALDVTELKRHLEEKGQRVHVEKDLCGQGFNGSLSGSQENGPLIVGACWVKFPEAACREQMRKKNLDPFALSVVPLLGEQSMDRATLLIDAAIERLKLFPGSSEKNLKPKLANRGGEMSRRQFLTLPKMQYEVVPSIMPERCNSITRHCSVCLRRCPSQAIRTDETGYALIEKEKCTGCGICVRACPSQAILYPGYSPAEITKQIDVLLAPANETRSSRRSILFACRNSKLIDSDSPFTGGSVPEGFFPIVVPCLGMLSSFYLLYAFLNGSTGVGMIACSSGKCAKGTDHDRLIAERDFTRTVLKNLGIWGRRVKVIEADSLSNLQKGLQCFSESLDEIDPSECSPEECVPVSLSEYSLPALLRTHACRPFIIEGSSAMPVGMISLKPDSSCTLCGVCVRYCPSGAMTEAGGDAKELRFYHMKCVACGECVGRCPEKALLLKRALDTEELSNPQGRVISREKEIECSECGTPFLTEAMLRRLRTGFSVSEADSILRMCPDCRSKTVFSALK